MARDEEDEDRNKKNEDDEDEDEGDDDDDDDEDRKSSQMRKRAPTKDERCANINLSNNKALQRIQYQVNKYAKIHLSELRQMCRGR